MTRYELSREETITQTIKLSPFDQLLRLYVHKLFCFPFPEACRQPEALLRIQHALSATIFKWPFITGYVCPVDTTTQHNAVQLCYEAPCPGLLPDHILSVNNISPEALGGTYQELAGAGMPPSALKMELLSTLPEWPKPKGVYPALAVQANFIPGGLIICFAFHHAVADGGTFIQFIKAFAEATKSPVSPDTALLCTVAPRIAYSDALPHEVRDLRSFPEYSASDLPKTSAIQQIYQHIFLPRLGSLISHVSGKVWPKEPHPVVSEPRQVITRILTFSAGTVQALEKSINELLKNFKDPPHWASPVACLTSLVWVAVVRARQDRLRSNDKAKIGIAVDARPALELPGYFGNAVVHTHAIAPVYDLLPGPNTNPRTKCGLDIDALAHAAQHMRRATEGVNKTYVIDRLKTFSSLEDPTEVPSIFERAMDTSKTGIDFSSWIGQGADLEFGIPGIGSSTIAFWRKAWSPNEGAYNILPRKGGSKGMANWEVSIGLSVEDMEKVCQQLQDGGWLERIIE